MLLLLMIFLHTFSTWTLLTIDEIGDYFRCCGSIPLLLRIGRKTKNFRTITNSISSSSRLICQCLNAITSTQLVCLIGIFSFRLIALSHNSISDRNRINTYIGIRKTILMELCQRMKNVLLHKQFCCP